MTKQTFNNVQNMIEKELALNSNLTINTICECYGVTVEEYHEYLELALLGFKDKYNQHNHPENNKETTNV